MIEELNIQKDHVHMVVSVPPKVSISDFMGVMKGKTAIKLFKSYPNLKKKPYWGNHFWGRDENIDIRNTTFFIPVTFISLGFCYDINQTGIKNNCVRVIRYPDNPGTRRALTQ